ncbi:hypothetical protein KCV06_g323, partial [Aureobasidium melanogenum]
MKGDSHCGCACGGNDARSLVFDNTSTFLSPVSPPYLKVGEKVNRLDKSTLNCSQELCQFRESMLPATNARCLISGNMLNQC